MLKDRIKEARLRKGMSQKEVAAILGIAVSTYSGYETGKSEPDVNKICIFMDALDVDANYLWQDYNVEETKNSPAPEDAREGVISLDRATAALVAMGYIREGEQLSDDDLAFLTHVMGLLDAWFSREQQ